MHPKMVASLNATRKLWHTPMNVLIKNARTNRTIATRARTLEVLKAIAELYRDRESHIKLCGKLDGFYEDDEKAVVSIALDMGGNSAFIEERDTVTVRVAGGKEHYRVEQIAELLGPAYSGKAST